MKVRGIFFVLIALSLVLSACGTSASDDSGAAKAGESYLNALVNKDADSLSTLSCADWESSALMEMDSFEAVTPRLDSVSCSVSGSDDSGTQVNCAGKIITTYDSEDSELDLSRWTYNVVQNNGTWLVCGYK